MTELHVRVTEMSICAIPFDTPDAPLDADLFTIRVQWRGVDRYAVYNRGRVLAVDHPGLSEPEWLWEPIPSEREDEFKARTRFDYDTAYRLACEQATRVQVMGMTAGEFTARSP